MAVFLWYRTHARTAATLAAALLSMSMAIAPSTVVAAEDRVPAADLHEHTQMLTVTVRDEVRATERTADIPLTIWKPDGDGPFPLVVIAHGRLPKARLAEMNGASYEMLARYWVRNGFVVVVPVRIGYGTTVGDFDPELPEPRLDFHYATAGLAGVRQLLAAHDAASAWPFVDGNRWIVVGESYGGMLALATASRKPPGLVGVVNFSGGAGGDPKHCHGRPCATEHVTEWIYDLAHFSRGIPTLWIYWRNDELWGADAPRRWFDAWTAGGSKGEWDMLPPAGPSGHGAVNVDMDHWTPIVDAFLVRNEFTPRAPEPRPAASGFAAIDDVERVPLPPQARDTLYKRFLDKPAPRAFAIGPDGAAGWYSGDWAITRALAYCARRRGAACRLYAVDDEVVWR